MANLKTSEEDPVSALSLADLIRIALAGGGNAKATIGQILELSSALTVYEYAGSMGYMPIARKLFVRYVDDPDPVAEMADGDLLIDLSVDTTPAAFTFTAYSGALPSFVYTSAAATLSGFSGTPAVSVTGGEWRKSSDSGSTWTSWGSASGVASNGDQVQVRGTSNATAAGTTTVNLDVGGVVGSYVITTLSTLEKFDGSSGAYTGGTLFDIYDAGGGATTLNGSGSMVQTCTSTSHGALASRKAVFAEGSVKKYRRHFNQSAVGGSTMILVLQKNLNSNKSQLAPTSNATWGTNNTNVIWMGDNGGINYKDSGGSTVSYNHSTNAWGSSSPYSLSLSTDYVAEIESDGTRWRCAWYDASDVLLKQTPWINWSATLARNSFTYIDFGDYLTDFGTVTAQTKTYGEG